MSDITLITPPDRLHSTELTFLLIFPSSIVKDQFQNLIANTNLKCHVYLYENDVDVTWLLDTFYQSDYVILDIDNCTPKIRELSAFFISKDKTFWLTKGGESYYNNISKNRIFNLDYLQDKIGGTVEKEQ